MIWAAIFKAMMGMGLSLAIEKTASAGVAPPVGGAGSPMGLLLTLTYPS